MIEHVIIWGIIGGFAGFCFWQNRPRVVDPSKPNEYNLRRISDLAEIPNHIKRVECMGELLYGLELVDRIREATKKRLPRWLHWAIPFMVKIRKFVWIDDGMLNSSVVVNGREITLFEKEEAK